MTAVVIDKQYPVAPILNARFPQLGHIHLGDVVKRETVGGSQKKLRLRLLGVGDVQVDQHQFQGFLMPFSQRGGVQNLDSNAAYLRFETTGDYEDWLERMGKIDTVIEQTIEVADRGIDEEMVLPRVLMERIPDQIAVQLVEDGTQNPFYGVFETMPDTIPAKDQDRLRATAIKRIEGTVVPAYRELAQYFENTYLPASRDSIGRPGPK